MRIKVATWLACLCLVSTNICGQTRKTPGNFSGKIVFESISQKLLSTVNQNEVKNVPISLTVKLDYDDSNYIVNDEKGQTRKQQLQNSKNFHMQKNQAIANSMDLSSYENIYVSTYSPYISIQTNWEAVYDNQFASLNMLAQNSKVNAIYVNTDNCTSPTLYDAEKFTGLNSYITDSAYSGEGVVVGILEGGIADVNNSNFTQNKNLQVRDEWYYFETVTEHSTVVASIIGGENGIAPKSSMLSVELSGDPVSEIDWLLDRNVNVINMSFGDTDPNGVYSSISAYMDYISYTYKITLVASAGNEGTGSGCVGNPGLGYNVITVGSCGSKTADPMPFSSYKTNTGPKKPNFVAPGGDLIVPGFRSFYSGTSFSAPIVTGCVALLMQKYSYLKTHPGLVHSMLQATAVKPDDSYYGNNLKERIGTGAINFDNVIKNIYNNYYYELHSSSVNFAIRNMYATVGQTIRAVVKWTAKATGNTAETDMSDFDLYIKSNPEEVILSDSIKSSDCLEIVEWKATYTGFHILDVVASSRIFPTEELDISYFIYD